MTIFKGSTSFIFLSILILAVLSFSSAFAVTDYVFFSVNSDTSLTTMTQGDFFGWGANCDIGTSVYFEIWYDVNNNSSLETGIDVIFETFTITDGVVIPDEIISDNNAIADGYVQTGSFPIIFEAGNIILKAVNNSDGTSAFRVMTINSMDSPPNQVNGQVIVPGHPAPDAILANNWIIGESNVGFFIGLTDINGNYSFNIGSDGTGEYLFIEPDNIDGFVAPNDQDVVITGIVNDVDFTYIASVDSVYGFVKDNADQTLPTINGIECYPQFGGVYKDAQTNNGRYVFNFADGEQGAWSISLYRDNLIPDYLIPNDFQFSHDTIGSFQHDLIVIPSDTVLYVRVTEDGGEPTNSYLIQVYSDLLASQTEAISGIGSNNIIPLYISSLDNSGWIASISTWDDRFPIPPTYIVDGQITSISPGDTVTINLSSSGVIVSDMMTLDPGDDPIDWSQVWVNLNNDFGANYGANVNPDGSFIITCDTGTFFLNAYVDGYLAFPAYREVHVTGDTTGNLGFEFNKVHARITGSLVNIPTPVTTPDLGVFALTGSDGSDGYTAWSEIDYINGTYTMYLCDGDFNVFPPHIDGYDLPSSIFMAIADPPDTLRIHDFVYTPISGGCCVNPTGDMNFDGEDIPNINDLLFLVDYMFLPPGAAPEPECMEEANVDGLGDAIPNIADLLYLVDYMFLPPGQAPAPVDCL